jgi:DNA-directed RNA polymerase specialized sigma24 family protein
MTFIAPRPFKQPAGGSWLAGIRQGEQREHIPRSTEDEHLKRLEGDQNLLLEVALHGFQGRSWERFATRLVRYAMGTLRGWLRNGRIFRECARMGRPVKQRPIGPADIDDLVAETIGRAILSFRDEVLVKRKWEPGRGASIPTFFVGHCLRQFPNVYRSWCKQTDRARGPVDRDIDTFSASLEGVEHALRLREAVATIPDEIAEIAAGAASGLTYDEIGPALGQPPRTVESKKWRYANCHTNPLG